jgi:5-methylcytosine-specific restriction endonuclease McrA
MARVPDFPCPGCGKLLWTNTRTSAAPEKRLCQTCRRSRSKDTSQESEKAKYAVRKAAVSPRPCAQCGVDFTPCPNGRGQKPPRTCSLSCGQRLRWTEGRTPWGARIPEGQRSQATTDRWQRKNRRRRALKRGAAHEPYSLAEIAERDGNQCGICGWGVPMSLRCPHLLAPTIDHIVPIALGGDDTPVNVQLAHFTCNSRKGARVLELVT